MVFEEQDVMDSPRNVLCLIYPSLRAWTNGTSRVWFVRGKYCYIPSLSRDFITWFPPPDSWLLTPMVLLLSCFNSTYLSIPFSDPLFHHHHFYIYRRLHLTTMPHLCIYSAPSSIKVLRLRRTSTTVVVQDSRQLGSSYLVQRHKSSVSISLSTTKRFSWAEFRV